MFARLGLLFGRMGFAVPAGAPEGGGPDDPDDFTVTFLSMGQY